ncbi:olfactory receptor 5V1-like [Pantherophis guttatus]|uniref:Olfactory receptor n=1 Tax=Pantherophis guttatus TaxID=94885 RepID=A0ABM3Z8E0_PANGU|nr:olfactory receptor 5V1-like [Pantherophis guttatus]
MDFSNHTLVTEFVFLGFSNITHGQVYLILLFLIIYLVTILGNFMIITLILVDSHLHSPMYFFLSHLSCLDVCYSTVTVPKILANLLRQRHTISYNLCFAQMFFLMAFSGSECWLLAIMAYDRYAAICQPLRYSHLMSPRVCMQAAVIIWIWGFLDAAVHTALASNFHFCGHNQIYHIFCDLPPLLKIACGDKFVSEITIHLATVFVGLGPFLFVVISYFYILASILRIRSNTGRHKAFSTCISHVMVVILYFGNGAINYNQPSAGYSLETDTLISTMYCIVTPMVNPLIYSLRNKEVKGALRKILERHRRMRQRRSPNEAQMKPMHVSSLQKKWTESNAEVSFITTSGARHQQPTHPQKELLLHLLDEDGAFRKRKPPLKASNEHVEKKSPR